MLGNSDCTLYCCTPDLIQCIYIYRISLKLHVRAFKDIQASDIINNNSDKPSFAILLRRICAVYLRRLFAPFICADFLSGRIFMLEVFPCQTSHMRLPGLLVCFLPCDEHIFCAEFAPFICAVYLRRLFAPFICADFKLDRIFMLEVFPCQKSHMRLPALSVCFFTL